MREAERLIMRAISDLEEGADVQGTIYLLEDALEAIINRSKYLRGRSPQEERWIGGNARKSPPAKKKRRQSPKQKLLHAMAEKKWKSYKRKFPKGKKTYVTIRGEVSRSQAYKKKARKL